MSRLDSSGGFGGPRLVKPQANVYTVLLLIACLFMAAALAMQLYRIRGLNAQPSPNQQGQNPSAVVVVPDRPADLIA